MLKHTKTKKNVKQVRAELVESVKQSPALIEDKDTMEQILELIPKMTEEDLNALKNLISKEKQDLEDFLQDIDTKQKNILNDANTEIKKIEKEATVQVSKFEKGEKASDVERAEHLLDDFDKNTPNKDANNK